MGFFCSTCFDRLPFFVAVGCVLDPASALASSVDFLVAFPFCLPRPRGARLAPAVFLAFVACCVLGALEIGSVGEVVMRVSSSSVSWTLGSFCISGVIAAISLSNVNV